jgi:hypothetical protein
MSDNRYSNRTISNTARQLVWSEDRLVLYCRRILLPVAALITNSTLSYSLLFLNCDKSNLVPRTHAFTLCPYKIVQYGPQSPNNAFLHTIVLLVVRLSFLLLQQQEITREKVDKWPYNNNQSRCSAQTYLETKSLPDFSYLHPTAWIILGSLVV